MSIGYAEYEHRQRLRDLAKRIVTYPRSAAGCRGELIQATKRFIKSSQYAGLSEEEALQRLFNDSSEIGDLLRRAVATLTDAPLSDGGYGLEDEDEDDDATDIDKANRDRGGAHQLTGALLQHLHDALDRKRERHGFVEKTAKESPMQDSLKSIMKAGSVAGVCAAIVSKGATTISEHELVEAVTKVAAERHPELTAPAAFAKVYADPGPEGRVVREAISVAKVSGPDARDVDTAAEAEKARAELMAIGRKQYPRLTENQVFERAFSDPRNAAIVARMYHRPSPTSIYPMPREWLRDIDATVKADRSDGSAYSALMAKAEQLRTERPELSAAQAFAKVFTDPANAELAKRERAESAPR